MKALACPLDPGCGGTGMARDFEVAFCVGESCEEVMCQCTGAGWARLAAVQGSQRAGVQVVAVVLLWTCGFVKVVWIVMAVSEQNQKQVRRVADGMILPYLKFCLAFVHQCSSFSIKKKGKNSYVNLLIPHLAGLHVKAACRALNPGKFLIHTGMNIAELISITYLDARKVCLFCPGSFVASSILLEYMH